MSGDLVGHPKLERILSAVLGYGTWLASGLIALGLALAVGNCPIVGHLPLSLSGMNIVMGGVALLILLPVFRVALMLIFFLVERDYRFVAISAFVLAIIFLGFLFGTHRMPHGG
jgi:hypothetical protein